MKFKDYLMEQMPQFSEKTLEELELLLAQRLNHLKNLEEHKESNETSYNATYNTTYNTTKKDIQIIKATIQKIKKLKKAKKVPGNQDVTSSDSMDTAVQENK